MHVELILEPLAEGDTQRHTSWELWHYGHRLAVSGMAYRNQADALRALSAVTGGFVVRARGINDRRDRAAALVLDATDERPWPAGHKRHIEIRRRRRRVPTLAPAHTMDAR